MSSGRVRGRGRRAPATESAFFCPTAVGVVPMPSAPDSTGDESVIEIQVRNQHKKTDSFSINVEYTVVFVMVYEDLSFDFGHL
jgi:hypothetical protein